MKSWGFWRIKENCINDAKNYNSKIEWQLSSYGAYDSARKRNWLNECCAHMENIGSIYKRLIYAFEFSDNSVYVGLTYNPQERKNAHYTNQKSQVNKHMKKTGLLPKFILKTDYLNKTDAIIKEGLILNQYKIKGWNILNNKKTGGLGGSVLYWTKEKCIEDAKKYKSRGEWSKKSNGAYESARNNNWLEESCEHMQGIKPKNFWNKENFIKIANTHKTKKDFRKSESGGYSIGLKRGWLKLVFK